MRFFLHGSVSPAAIAALARHEHKTHTASELSAEGEAPAPALDQPGELVKILAEKQWQLLTTDSDLVRRIYEEKVEFPHGIVVHLLDDPEVLADQGAAIERLFERYPRLTVKRMYTVTAHRVKIRQLPGMPR